MDKVNSNRQDRVINPDKLYTESDFQEGRTVVQFRDNELMICDMGGRPPDDQQREIMLSARKTAYGGKMTDQAQKRMTRALTLLSQSIKPKWITNPVTGRIQFFKLALISLTVSSRRLVSHKEAKRRCLDPFLRWLRYSHRCRHYVWKAELQERGQIHYHIVVPRFIPYDVIRDKWNDLQRDAGYLRDYTAATKKMNPNSTDVKAIGNEKKVAKYLIKYLGKGADTAALIKKNQAKKDLRSGLINQDQYRQICDDCDTMAATIDGKIWDCSEALNGKYFTLLITWRGGMNLAQYIRDNIDSVFYGERFMRLEMDFNKPPDFMRFAFKQFRMYLDLIAIGGAGALSI